jgi:hypothetical protein
MAVFWDVVPCSLVEIADISDILTTSFTRVIRPWWWSQQVPLKFQLISTRLQDAMSQKSVIFIVFAMRTWNITKILPNL